jgi:CO dehydrogenase maturation factor
MKVAFVGKGGAGKSALAGTFCRHLARGGEKVLAMDIDTMAGLALSLGLGSGGARLPAGLAERVEGKGWHVKPGSRPSRLVDRYALIGPDGVGFLELGKLPGHVEPTVTVAFRYVLERFRRRGRSIVADLAAGTRQPMFGWARFARTVLVVADSSSKSTLTARRLAKAGIGTHLVANKVQSPADLAAIEAAVPLPLLGWIPFDPAFADAEAHGRAAIDAVPHGPAVCAVAAVATRLRALAA